MDVEQEKKKIRIGISACLLGQPVRYDGGHKLDRFLVDTLGEYVEYVPVCPEVELGLPTPRQTLRLVGDPLEPRLVFSKSGEDITDAMNNWARVRVRELEKEQLCGFIFKSRSPSSGMERVKVYDRHGNPRNKGVGLFAQAFMEQFPLLPTEEDGRLHDPGLRENFIESIFVMRRWRSVLDSGTRRGDLVDFHSRHKLLLMGHSVELYREMGRLVANAGDINREELFQKYQNLLLQALQVLTTEAKHVNVLHHILGYFKKQLSADEKEEMLELIEHYRQGHIPLIVPVTMMNHFVRKYDQPYLRDQVYLHPHPVELQLRNHA
ncbi:MAG: DUF523 and DUF1722 domain-containing protein [Desulfuromonadales bacterium]